jgi:hypothetical protein
MRKQWKQFICGGLFCLCGWPALAGDPLPMKTLAQAPAIDGQMSAGEWDDAAQARLDIQIEPGNNAPASEATTAWLGHHDGKLYVAFHARDSAPETIRARVTRRDDVFDDDFVAVYLDAFNDRQRAYGFFFNPLGMGRRACGGVNPVTSINHGGLNANTKFEATDSGGGRLSVGDNRHCTRAIRWRDQPAAQIRSPGGRRGGV